MKNFENILKSAKIDYPGDPSFDALYYKLNLNVSYSPNNLKGEVTVIGKSLRSNLTRVFLDFSESLFVDSIKGYTNHNYTHSNSVDINLEHSLAT
jgi:hypothetical protein